MTLTSIKERLATKAATSIAFIGTLCITATPALAQDENNVTIGKLIKDSGPIGMAIIVLSIVSLAIIIENFVSLKRDKLAPPELIDEIQALFDDEQYQEAMELCENEPNYFTRVCDEESIKLHQKIGWLALISNLAPMMGLLGTVSGMVAAFNTIATSGGQASPAELASGISQALLTTMFGLFVAIPVTAAFAFIRNRLVKSIIEVGAIVEDLFERFRGEVT
ncbi:MAG: biopolymer transport protein ExbB [Planctomycetota bacterium]|jgi:biopolymer transport protein ExbB